MELFFFTWLSRYLLPLLAIPLVTLKPACGVLNAANIEQHRNGTHMIAARKKKRLHP
ncbi:MAG: hypothetical protein ACYDH1_13395 [Anaerolineaceae bacterium]